MHQFSLASLASLAGVLCTRFLDPFPFPSKRLEIFGDLVAGLRRFVEKNLLFGKFNG